MKTKGTLTSILPDRYVYDTNSTSKMYLGSV